jgi:hypothetical protein
MSRRYRAAEDQFSRKMSQPLGEAIRHFSEKVSQSFRGKSTPFSKKMSRQLGRAGVVFS